MDENLRYYCIFRGSVEDPRLKQWQLRRRVQKMGHPMDRKTIAKYFKKAKDQYIILDPKLIIYNHENLRHRVYLLQSREPISGIKKLYLANKEKIAHVIGGGNAFNMFLRAREDIDPLGFPVMFRSFCGDYMQTIPQQTCDECSVLSADLPLEKGVFSINLGTEPLTWDSIDWNIYNWIAFKPYIPLKQIAEELDLHQTTVKNRFINHIRPATHWLSGYFEKGYLSYTGVMIQVRTDYEQGLFDRISRLSASAYFLKVLEDWLFILVYVVDVKILIKYFNALLEQKRIKEYSYAICYDYLPRRE
ncbi:MAG: hypothetical protein HXS48_07715 [Theionarchaea archaeon]|nr:hypothetical protein [Theionarchaea archaeon]